MNDSAIITVRVTPETKRRLETLAAATKRSKSFLAADAIERFLAEDAWQVEQIGRGVADADAGRVIDAEHVHAWMRSWFEEEPLPRPDEPDCT
jgi:RHH-type transcriptional regulator, rel operon repressor / antitoxin RelB